MTPIAVALAQSLGVSPRPFLVAVMMAGSAAFATPFGYQTNVIVYQLGGYRDLDFVRVGLPLTLITFVVAVTSIHTFLPFLKPPRLALENPGHEISGTAPPHHPQELGRTARRER